MSSEFGAAQGIVIPESNAKLSRASKIAQAAKAWILIRRVGRGPVLALMSPIQSLATA